MNVLFLKIAAVSLIAATATVGFEIRVIKELMPSLLSHETFEGYKIYYSINSLLGRHVADFLQPFLELPVLNLTES